MIELDVIKSLFVLRHGESKVNSIKEVGIVQMQDLAKRIREIAGDGPYCLLTSNNERGIQSAEVIARALSLPLDFERSKLLFEVADQKALQYIEDRRNKAQYLIAVGHHHFVDSFPRLFCRQEFGIDTNIRELLSGEGVNISIDSHAYELLAR